MKFNFYYLPVAAAVITAALLITGCDTYFSAEVEEQEFCLVRADAEVPGDLMLDGAVDYPIDFNLSDTIPQLDQSGGRGEIEGEIRLTSLTFTAKSGVSDFGFVNHLSGKAISRVEGTTLPDIGIFSYDRPANYSPDPVLQIEGTPGVNVFDYLSSGAVTVNTTFEGTLPLMPWKADVEVCFYVRTKYKY